MATQMVIDLYGCDADILNDEEKIQSIARETVQSIGAEIIEECVRRFEPIGITYFAIISTSHFSVHTWPEYRYAAIDVFSCKEPVAQTLSEELKKSFDASDVRTHTIERRIGL